MVEGHGGQGKMDGAGRTGVCCSWRTPQRVLLLCQKAQAGRMRAARLSCIWAEWFGVGDISSSSFRLLCCALGRWKQQGQQQFSFQCFSSTFPRAPAMFWIFSVFAFAMLHSSALAKDVVGAVFC